MQEKVKAPAIAMLILGVLQVLQGLGVLVLSLFVGSIARMPGFADRPEAVEIERMGPMITVFYGAASVFLLAVAGFVIFAALRMMKLRSWTLCLIAAILTAVPCTSLYVCILGVPIGIWAIVVLLDKQVKSAFEGTAAGPSA